MKNKDKKRIYIQVKAYPLLVLLDTHSVHNNIRVVSIIKLDIGNSLIFHNGHQISGCMKSPADPISLVGSYKSISTAY